MANQNGEKQTIDESTKEDRLQEVLDEVTRKGRRNQAIKA